LQGSLSIERMCQLAVVSRASFYRYLQPREPELEEMAVRSAVQEVALQHRRRYGSRRIARVLQARGMRVGRKRVQAILRRDNLLALRRRKYVATTESTQTAEVYVNLARRMKLSGVNQLWVADITYIRLWSESVYLAVILDAFSRRVIGWELDRNLDAQLAVNALQAAIRQRQPPPGLVHHSDRGTQYVSKQYVELLKQHQMLASMSRPANPLDNAICESFIKTLKQEEIHANRYRDLRDLRAHVREFIESYYNHQRLHSALGYRSPEEFEQALQNSSPPAARVEVGVSE